MHLQFVSLLGTDAFRQLDDIVRDEVAPYVSTLNALPSSIQRQARDVADEYPCDFFINLKRAWRAHNELALELSKFLIDLYSANISWTSSSTLVAAQALLGHAYDTEDQKRIYSAGVKLALDRYIGVCTRRYHLNENDVGLLLSCWRPDFWSYRLGVHAKLCLAERCAGEPSLTLRQKIALDLHGGETLLLRERLARPPLVSLCSMSKRELAAILLEIKEINERTKEFSRRGCYLVMGRPDLRAIQGIIQYDNFYEHVFGYSRYGLPDFFFRKEVCWLLQRRGLLEYKPSVVLYSRDELHKGLEALQLGYGTAKFYSPGLGAAGISTDATDDLWGRMLHDGDFRIFSRPNEFGSGGARKKTT